MSLHITTFLRQHDFPIADCPPYILAISGGLDSMVMAHAFVQEQIPVVLAHCNFGLRGAESDADEAFVRTWAQQRNLIYHIEHFETEAYAQAQGISIQMAARCMRYDFFDRLRQMHAYGPIATAHHADDTIETVLMQLGRGSGLAGMCGIPEVTEQVVRPLLQYSRMQLAAWALATGVAWREDSSNLTDDYLRNRIRHHVIPELEQAQEAGKDFRKQALLTMSNLRKAQNNYHWLLDERLRQFLKSTPDGILHLSNIALTTMPNSTELLRHWLRPKGFDDQTIEHVGAHLGQSGRTWSAGNWTITIDRHDVQLQDRSTVQLPTIEVLEEDILVRLGQGKTLFITQADASAKLQNTPDTCIVPRTLLIWPLKVRVWQEGDTFQPFGMKGKHQKVSDFLVNMKLSVAEKSTVRLLVTAQDTPVWLMGLRTDERFRVQSGEPDLVKFTLVG
jgi:tRNA(Ile)-lysidine synthase